jgi:hypothetical protein
MKALKTIVATAVIVFALTTVAVAGVQHLGRAGDDATSAGQAPQAAAQPAAQGGVTLSARQFAALLRAADGSGSQGRASTRAHGAKQGRAHENAKVGTHARHQAHSHAAAGSAGSGSSAGATHHTAVQQTETHHTATHTTGHAGGTHDGATHDGDGDGGCD